MRIVFIELLKPIICRGLFKSSNYLSICKEVCGGGGREEKKRRRGYVNRDERALLSIPRATGKGAAVPRRVWFIKKHLLR